MWVEVVSNQGWNPVRVVSEGSDSIGIDFLRVILYMKNLNNNGKVNERILHVIDEVNGQ